MKNVVAIIKPFKLDEVREELARRGLRGFTVTEVKGCGQQKGHTEIWRGAEYAVSFLPKVRLDIVVEDHEVDHAVQSIVNAAYTGGNGDGKIWVGPIEQLLSIRKAGAASTSATAKAAAGRGR